MDPRRRQFISRLMRTLVATPGIASLLALYRDAHANGEIDPTQFIQGAASSLAGLGSGGGSVSIKANQLDFTKMKDFIASAAGCLEWATLGPCCWLCPVRWIVTHWLPVLFVEVHTGIGDSVFLKQGSYQSSTRIDRGHRQAFEVRIWEIPWHTIQMAFAGMRCKLCDKESARLVGRIGSLLGGGSSGDGLCDAGSAATYNILQSFNSELMGMFGLDCTPKLIYDSQLDILNWRTGCRDLGSATPLAENIGDWGPLYPRQMLLNHMTSTVASAITAYRAIHIATYTTHKNEFDGSKGSKLQYVYPEVSECMHPGGKSITAVESDVKASSDGLYGFLWWVRVSCCKWKSEIMGACPPPLPCLGG